MSNIFMYVEGKDKLISLAELSLDCLLKEALLDVELVEASENSQISITNDKSFT